MASRVVSWWRPGLWGAAAAFTTACGGDRDHPAPDAREAVRASPESLVANAVPGSESIPSVAAVQLTAEQRRGEAVYDTFCWTCHGRYGNGDGPAARGFRNELPELARVAASLSVDQIVARLMRQPTGGSPPGGPAVWHALGSDEVRVAVSYIKTFAPYGSGGNPAAGRLIYATYCVHCHGARGAGDGRLAARLSRRPANLRSVDSARQPDRLLAKLKAGGTQEHGAFMPDWGRVFGDRQLWDVIAYLQVLAASR